MSRRTFFSFHYEADVHRSWIVRNSWVTKIANSERDVAGFFDSSVFEAAQRTSDESLKRFLRDGLRNTSVTCVLVGAKTALRRWVRYEIIRSFVRGNGLLAVRINEIADMDRGRAQRGSNPFDSLAFLVDDCDWVHFREYTSQGWQLSEDVGAMSSKGIRYDLDDMTNNTFSSLFPIYDWYKDDGRENLGDWIEEAALDAGR